MSLITISYDPFAVDFNSDPFRLFPSDIQYIVADALSIPGIASELYIEDIQVEVREFGDRKFGDNDIHGKNQLEITVLANEYPERRVNLDERRAKITKELRVILRDTRISGSVWVFLAPGSFEQL